MKSAWRDGSRTRKVELQSLGSGRWRVRVDDAEFTLASETLADGRLRLASEDGATLAEVTAAGTRRFVRLGSLDFVLDRESSSSGRRSTGAEHGGLEAPMPGAVTRVMIEPGDDVSRGQPLVAVEAMKMEHIIRAPRDGRVRSVRARVGDMVAPGLALVEFDPEA